MCFYKENVFYLYKKMYIKKCIFEKRSYQNTQKLK